MSAPSSVALTAFASAVLVSEPMTLVLVSAVLVSAVLVPAALASSLVFIFSTHC